MRQAGRSLPEYREIRQRYNLFEVCRRPELCAEVTLQPVRAHGVDAAVMFADIMLPVIGMGIDVELVENVGPVIAEPIESLEDVRRLVVPEPEESVPFILEAVRIVRAELEPDEALIGFCGGPFTVAGYLIEGKPTRDFLKTKQCMYGAPEVWHGLMEKLTETSIAYLAGKVRAGADVIQLFDSWVGHLSVDDYREFVAPYSARILETLDVPTIHFGTGTTHLLEDMAEAGGDVIGIDWRIPHRPGLGSRRARPGRPGEPRSDAPARGLGASRAGSARHPRCGGRTARAHLQPGPRRSAGDRSRRPGPHRRACARANADRGGRVKSARALGG